MVVDLEDLIEAVHALYFAGYWRCDRPVNEISLWANLRKAAGIPSGTAPKPLKD